MVSLGNESTVGANDVWLTPPSILGGLGVFDLDPCASVGRPWDTALNHFTVEDDGLSREWFGRVWCNPPYGRGLGEWLRRLSEHGDGIAFIFARTETKVFFDWVWDKADALLFLRGRVRFHRPDGSLGGYSGAPSVLVAYGERNVDALRLCGLDGKLVVL